MTPIYPFPRTQNYWRMFLNFLNFFFRHYSEVGTFFSAFPKIFFPSTKKVFLQNMDEKKRWLGFKNFPDFFLHITTPTFVPSNYTFLICDRRFVISSLSPTHSFPLEIEIVTLLRRTLFSLVRVQNTI